MMADDEGESGDVEKFKALSSEALLLGKAKKYEQALALFHLMYKIRPSNNLWKKIETLQNYLLEKEEESSDDEGEMINLEDGFSISEALYKKLYPHQRDGIKWLWSLYQRKKGGILADEAGLGKTILIASFLSGLFDSERIKTVLIVMSAKHLDKWEDEFSKWCPGMIVLQFHGSSLRNRERNLEKIKKNGGVMLTSYDRLVKDTELLATKDGCEFKWDYLILNEGHKIKNPTKTTKAACKITAIHRLVLTGTPVQNNLGELWALFDFCHKGSLLGTLATFKREFENPIATARQKDATSEEKKQGRLIAQNLRTIIQPYFLRRTKTVHKATLPPKNEFVVWVYLSDNQIDLYKQFLMSEDVQRIMTSNTFNLAQMQVLKKICDHPRLLSRQMCAKLDMENSYDQIVEEPTEEATSTDMDPNLLLKESGKMKFLVLLLENLKENGHKTLVFSMSRKILDFVEKILKFRRWPVMRVDGTVKELSKRDGRIKKFQEDDSYPVMLLTTQVATVDLNIRGVDRIVIYDPSWNPTNDTQAVNSAHHLGQNKPVIVYRLITCGSIEEKIYRRQIFKDAIARQVSGKAKMDKNPQRYFTESEMKDLSILDNPKNSKTQRLVAELHERNRKTTPELDTHIAFLLSLKELVFNISDHDLMFRDQTEEELGRLDEAASAAKESLVDNYIPELVVDDDEIIPSGSKHVDEASGGLNVVGIKREFHGRKGRSKPKKTRIPMAIPMETESSDNSTENPPKSRRSICALPMIALSDEETSDDEDRLRLSSSSDECEEPEEPRLSALMEEPEITYDWDILI